MIDFSKNTYFVKRTEKDEVIKILKRHPEYRGFDGISMFNNAGLYQGNYNLLWEQIEDNFTFYKRSNIQYLDNEYITDSKIKQHPWLIGLAEVYTNDESVQHTPQPLLPELKKIDRQLMRIE